MRISTKGRYGLRAMLDLAIYSGGEQISIKDIAERQNVSENYLEQVFSSLRKAGLVKSVKGAQGGYMLMDYPANISVGKILRVLEGDISVVEEESINSQNDPLEAFIFHNVWEPINKAIGQVVDSITLEDMVNEYNRISGEQTIMYYI